MCSRMFPAEVPAPRGPGLDSEQLPLSMMGSTPAEGARVAASAEVPGVVLGLLQGEVGRTWTGGRPRKGSRLANLSRGFPSSVRRRWSCRSKASSLSCKGATNLSQHGSPPVLVAMDWGPRMEGGSREKRACDGGRWRSRWAHLRDDKVWVRGVRSQASATAVLIAQCSLAGIVQAAGEDPAERREAARRPFAASLRCPWLAPEEAAEYPRQPGSSDWRHDFNLGEAALGGFRPLA
mmetsp:Transcript_22897/g.71346  ORF Transcript_22897/g.71346 Transcript_22897/m.71346 type:complete len:236 (+) Transcript_22897:310-1017(+)